MPSGSSGMTGAECEPQSTSLRAFRNGDARRPCYHTVWCRAGDQDLFFGGERGVTERERKGEWYLEAHDGLPASTWRRAVALWGVVSMPLFTAFDYRENIIPIVPTIGRVDRGSSACSGRARAFCRSPHRQR